MASEIRDSGKYKSLDQYLAIAIAEGFDAGEGATRYEQLVAFQFLIDCGVCWELQGWFGRTAQDLIDAGILLPADQE